MLVITAILRLLFSRTHFNSHPVFFQFLRCKCGLYCYRLLPTFFLHPSWALLWVDIPGIELHNSITTKSGSYRGLWVEQTPGRPTTLQVPYYRLENRMLWCIPRMETRDILQPKQNAKILSGFFVSLRCFMKLNIPSELFKSCELYGKPLRFQHQALHWYMNGCCLLNIPAWDAVRVCLYYSWFCDICIFLIGIWCTWFYSWQPP